MRPTSVEEVIGQDHLLETGSPLWQLIHGHGNTSIILYGPPGTGKTTLALLIAQEYEGHFVALSALNTGVKEIREVIDQARYRARSDKPTVVFIDEIHRFSKTQQDSLLGAVENGIIILVGATTENPSFSLISPLLSRSLVVQLHPLSRHDLQMILLRAINDPRGLSGSIQVDPAALELLTHLAGGDARRALTALEAASQALESSHQSLSVDLIEQSLDRLSIHYDKNGTNHYDVVSAFIKSLRGSDVDAALHYLARMITAGEDPRFIARRLIIFASEDIGLADSSALPLAVATAHSVEFIGMPEARLSLAHATIYLASAPKSNAVTTALSAAMEDIRSGKAGTVPVHLRDGHYHGAHRLGNAIGYRYPHQYPGGVVSQQYPPDELVDTNYYSPSPYGDERALITRIEKLRTIIRHPRHQQ